MARTQFTLRALLVAMLVVALGAGVVSWLPPQTRFDLAMFVQVFAVLFGMLFTGVLAVAVALYCLKLCRRAIGRLK